MESVITERIDMVNGLVGSDGCWKIDSVPNFEHCRSSQPSSSWAVPCINGSQAATFPFEVPQLCDEAARLVV